MTAEWQDYALYSFDNKLILSGNPPVYPRRYFRILKHLTFKKNKYDNIEYQIVDFGLFDRIRNPLDYSPGLFVPLAMNTIYRMGLHIFASFRIHHIYKLTKHDILRTMKPGRLICVPQNKELFGIFQGMTTKCLYAVLFSNESSFMLFQHLPIHYNLKELQKIFNSLLYTMAISCVHDS
jgi:hypothetical protein